MRYPLVKQDGLKDCGPCSLASIIIFYKGYISVNALEDMMHTTRNGTTAYNIIEAARKIGFESHGLKVENLDNITLPAIAYVTISKYYNHYIVIYKVDKKHNRILIGDPATKVKYIYNDEFNKIWNNIVITLIPNKILPYSSHTTLIKYILDIILKYKRHLIILTIISFVFMIISLLYSLFIKYMIDNINVLTMTLIISFILVFTFRTIINYIRNIMTIKLNKKISIDLTSKINKSLISLPYVYYRNHTSGEIVSRFNDVESIKDIISNAIFLFIGIPLIIMFNVLLFSLSNQLFIYTLMLIIVYILLNTILLINIKTNLNNFYTNLENTIYKYQKLYNLKNTLLDIVPNLTSILIIIIGFVLYKDNNITLGTLLSFYVIYNYLIEPINDISNFGIKFNEASNASRRIEELSYSKDITNNNMNGDIEYRSLTYKIGFNTILYNINLKIKKGEKVIITGPSGSGKSTLVKLLKGYYKTNNIHINNQEHHNSNNILYISQNEIIFTDTLYGNLMCENGSDKLVEEVVNTCLIDKNLNMYIEENGFNLSGGEKERIILGRTLLRNFDILIIDEGLSEIEVNKERIILKNMFNNYKDKTIIIITHRLDNLDLYDHFIEVNNGSIAKDEIKFT